MPQKSAASRLTEFFEKTNISFINPSRLWLKRSPKDCLSKPNSSKGALLLLHPCPELLNFDCFNLLILDFFRRFRNECPQKRIIIFLLRILKTNGCAVFFPPNTFGLKIKIKEIVMNEKKVRLEKSVGIINLILGIFEAVGGLLYLLLSSTIAGMFNGTIGQNGTGAAAAGNVMTAVVIVSGVLMMIFGIIMIVLAARLIRTPQISDNGVVADRKGIVIFFLVINIIAFLGSIMNFFGGAAMAISSVVIMLAYLASAILAGLSLKERHDGSFVRRVNNYNGSY